MSRKIYLLIITMVTVICIIGGTLYHVGRIFTGGLFSWFYFPKSSGVSFKEELSGIKNISISMDAMEVRFEEGESLSYNYEGPENLAPMVNVSGDTLSFENHRRINLNKEINDKTALVIYVPEEMRFNDVSISLDFGNIQIKKLICANLDIEADAGNIEIYESKFQKSDIEAALGNVETYDTFLGDADISCDMGNVVLRDADINSLDISNDLGNTEVYLLGKESDYEFSLSVDLGALTFNGKKYSSSYDSEGDGRKPVSIENDMGNITVSLDNAF